jgi:hypothetical protein
MSIGNITHYIFGNKLRRGCRHVPPEAAMCLLNIGLPSKKRCAKGNSEFRCSGVFLDRGGIYPSIGRCDGIFAVDFMSNLFPPT